jgi:hypothetical protein
MAGFFGISAWVATLCLAAALLAGHFGGVLGLRPEHHLLLGLLAAMLTVSLHCLVFGIFTGSGKDTRLLVQDLHLDKDFVKRTKAFKKDVFPPALYAILLLFGVTSLGGALSAFGGGIWPYLHAGLAWFTFYYNVKTFRLEYRAIRENSAILENVNREAVTTDPTLPDLELRISVAENGTVPAAIDHLEWGTHVFALGKFLCFLGYNVWLPFIYLRFIVGFYQMHLWPFLLTSLFLLLLGYALKWRYRAYRPSESQPAASTH